MRSAMLLISGILLLASTATVASQGAASPHASVVVRVVFTDKEIRVIRAHYESQDQRGRNGKSKRKQKPLPPGIAKNLERGKRLPPGIAKQNLPYQLQQSLPPVRDGYERVVIARKILLVEIATQVVRDGLNDIVFD